MKNHDISIVGAGPIGGFIANKLAKQKYCVAVFEKNKKIGIPMNCAGLVSSRVFENFNISKKGIIQNEIKGAYIHSPSGNVLSIGGDKVYSLVIDRTSFDQRLVSNAEKNGANIFLDTKACEISRSKEGLEIKTSKNTVYSSNNSYYSFNFLRMGMTRTTTKIVSVIYCNCLSLRIIFNF